MDKHYVQFGSGLCAPEGWSNFDVSPTLRLQRLPIVGRLFDRLEPRFPRSVQFGDVVRGLPVVDESCAAVYSSHVLEHLSLKDFRTALSNVYGHLSPGGHFRFVVPDLEALARTYVESDESDSANVFMRQSYLGTEERKKGVIGFVRAAIGNSKHLWMWDYKSISKELANFGFVDVRRAEIGDSSEPMFEVVESKDRWHQCLGVECRKPDLQQQSLPKAA